MDQLGQPCVMPGQRGCACALLAGGGEERATAGAGTRGRTGVQAAPGVRQAEAGGSRPVRCRRLCSTRCVCARAAGLWGVHGGDVCVGGLLRLCRWREACGVPGVAPVWSQGARESRHHPCMSWVHVGCIPGAAGVGVHGMARVQGMGGPRGTCTGVFAACWVEGAGPLPPPPGWGFPGRTLLAHLRAEVAVLPPAPVGLSQRGKLRHGASSGTVGKAGSPCSLLGTSTPSMGAELGSLTRGLRVQEVGWGAGGSPPVPVGASPG